MSEDSSKVFGWFQESSDKLDYFICGTSGALFAYIAQTYVPKKLEFGFSALEPTALLFLAISFWYGIKRIEKCVMIKRLNHAYLEAANKAEKLSETLNRQTTGSQIFENAADGHVLDRVGIELSRRQAQEQARGFRDQCIILQSKAERAYMVRDFFLFLGFCAIFAAKILQPYRTPVTSAQAVVEAKSATLVQSSPKGTPTKEKSEATVTTQKAPETQSK